MIKKYETSLVFSILVLRPVALENRLRACLDEEVQDIPPGRTTAFEAQAVAEAAP